MTILRPPFTTRRSQLAALTLTLVALVGCGSSETSEDAAPADTAASDASALPAETEAPGEGSEGGEAVECDTSTFVYEPFTEIPADWPEPFPRPELLENITGDVGKGCERVTVDMRGRYTGDARAWMDEYGDRLSDAGFELTDESDDQRQVLRTYRLGDDFINYGGDIELPDSDREYITVGIVLADFPG